MRLRPTIAVKLALGTVGVVLACLGPVFLLARTTDWARLVEGKAHAATMVTRTLADSVGPGIAFEDERAIREPVEALLKNDEVLGVRVSRAHAAELTLRRAGFEAPLESTTNAWFEAEEQATGVGPPRVAVRAPVELDGEQIGAVLVLVSLDREAAIHRANLSRLLMGFSLTGLALIIAVVLLFRGLVRRRIDSLVATAGALARGERVETNLGGNDEMTILASAIDAMARSIWTRQDEVARQHHALLEDRHRYADQLRAARDAALEHARAKTEFLATMSHELRTPMNGIIGMTRLLGTTELDVEQQEYVEMIRASSESLFSITSDVLDFSKLDAGKVQLEQLSFDVQDVLDEVVASMTGPASQKRIGFAGWCSPEVPRLISGDPPRLRQVLLNLVSNAIKFTEAGRVTIEASVTGSTLRFDIVDTGAGISPEAQARLFTPFTQADSSTTRRYGGTGLGLAIVKRLVALMGGTVGLSSDAGGSRFFVSLPLVVVEATTPPPLLNQSLALADDGSLEVRALEAHLLRAGARVTRLTTSSELDPQTLVLAPVAWLPQLRSHQGPVGVLVTSRVAVVPPPAQFQMVAPVRSQAVLSAIARVTGQPSPEAIAPEFPRFVGARVLVAEDNPINQRVIQGLLTKLGCEVAIVADGRQAIDAIERERFELVLMDCQMPVLDGLSATIDVRQRWSVFDLPIVALTANTSGDDRARCLAAGMNSFLSKPVRLETLAAELKRYLRERSSPDSRASGIIRQP
jgi:signal transduction histidine kinase/ActR/RegA family two-component response regulator